MDFKEPSQPKPRASKKVKIPIKCNLGVFIKSPPTAYDLVTRPYYGYLTDLDLTSNYITWTNAFTGEQMPTVHLNCVEYITQQQLDEIIRTS